MQNNQTLSVKDIFLLCVFNILLALVIYSPIRNSFFVFDDISTISITDPAHGKTWIDCFLVMGNGFWRPLILTSARLMLCLFGYNPLAFHTITILMHAVCALLTALVAARLGLPRKLSLLASCLLTAHFGAFPTVSQLQNIGDLFVTAAFLSALLFSDRWIRCHGSAWGLLLAFVIALAAKETGAIFPVIILIWSLRYRPLPSRFWKLWFVMAGLSLLFLAATFRFQHSSQWSYMGAGKLSFSFPHVLRQTADYVFSAFFPFIHIVIFPFRPIILPHGILWMIRCLILMAAGVIFCRSLINKEKIIYQDYAVFLALIFITIGLPSFLRGSPEGRFLYSSLPFAVLILTLAWHHLAGRPAVIYKSLIACLWAVFILSFFTSPSVSQYRELTRKVEVFVAETKQLAPRWKPGSQVCIFNHPHPGSPPWRWSYCQQLFNIFIPEARATVALDVITSDTVYVYRFENDRLIEMK